METQPEGLAEELARLRHCLDDLASVLSLPAIWSGGDAALVGRTILEALSTMLGLDLAYLRFDEPAEGRPVEINRVSGPGDLPGDPFVTGRLIDRWLGPDPGSWPPECRIPLESAELSLVTLHLGSPRQLDVLVAGSRRWDFPRRTDRLLLEVAANQVALGLQEARNRRASGGSDAAGPPVELRALPGQYAALSPRERDVLALVVSGLRNKQIGAELGISEITVKAHRGRVMRKMGASSLAELVTMAAQLRLGTGPEGWRQWNARGRRQVQPPRRRHVETESLSTP